MEDNAVYTKLDWEIDRTFNAEEGQQITKEIYDQFFECMPPIMISNGTYGDYYKIFLMSEPYKHERDSDGKYRAKHLAFGIREGKYYFIGIRFPENVI